EDQLARDGIGTHDPAAQQLAEVPPDAGRLPEQLARADAAGEERGHRPPTRSGRPRAPSRGRSERYAASSVRALASQEYVRARASHRATASHAHTGVSR